MKKIVLAVMMMVVVFGGEAGAWDKKDTTYEGLFLGTLTIDYLQTKKIVKSEDFHETNPILGRNPRQNTVDLYFLGCGVGHAAISYLLPNEYTVFGVKTNPRRLWQVVWIGVEASRAVYNYNIGVRVLF